MNILKDFDVIVIGGGHAGVEAAHAPAKMGSKTALITLDAKRIGYMPCNPAIGGIGKGHIVFEISALGGLMPQLCTKTYLQVRMLNTTKGPAVHGLRLQIDKNAYAQEAQDRLNAMDNLTIIEAMVDEILVNEKKEVMGVRLADGTVLNAPTVIVTSGTFLNGLVHVGMTQYESGRETEKAVKTLSDSLRSFGLELGRLKTGTPPRLKESSLDFSVMERQESDSLEYLFEFSPHKTTPKKDCYITHTNQQVHDIIKKNAHLSKILRKELIGTGPRYCPSIEDKITRFPSKNAHQIFVEPESSSTDWMYPNGLSTSLPLEIQQQYINAIKGFENAVIVRAGYAIEYDFVLPHQLKPTLEVKTVAGLFLAGQINGTTGYEEAAGQGIIAGINAHQKAHHKDPFVMDRTQGYIGVMIDDLTTMSVDEPYRMFTSRAERRLTLRQDNVFLRLSETAYQLGMIDAALYELFKEEKQIITDTIAQLKTNHKPTDLLRLFGDNTITTETVRSLTGTTLPYRACQTIQASIKYGPYLDREEREINRIKKYQNMRLASTLDFMSMDGISTEIKQKLTRHKPETVAQASLIPGMTPAALSLLILRASLQEKP